MNDLYTQEFVKQALQSGIPQEKIATLLNKADEISKRQSTSTKTASIMNQDIIGNLINQAGMSKTASSIAYTNGLFSEALVNGANIPQAMQFVKTALAETSKKVAFMEKVSAIANDPKLSQYAEGFLNRAKQAGLSEDDSVRLLVDVVDREKSAAHPDDMFKSAPPGAGGDPSLGGPQGAPPMPGGPGGDPGAGADPSGAGGPGGDEEAQILQMIQSLPPEEQHKLISALMAAIQGGGAGPGTGDPSQSGPAGAPPMPPQGGPPMPPPGAGPQ